MPVAGGERSGRSAAACAVSGTHTTGSTVVVDDKETAALVRRIVHAFAARWPAVLSDNTTNPMIPLGPLAEGQTRQSFQQEQRRGWRRLFGG
jgi:hypothetical protein